MGRPSPRASKALPQASRKWICFLYCECICTHTRTQHNAWPQWDIAHTNIYEIASNYVLFIKNGKENVQKIRNEIIHTIPKDLELVIKGLESYNEYLEHDIKKIASENDLLVFDYLLF